MQWNYPVGKVIEEGDGAWLFLWEVFREFWVIKKKKFPKYWVLFLVCLISDPEERGGWDNFKFVFG